jgi:DNA-directed RNA polymerase II subunit RPB1
MNTRNFDYSTAPLRRVKEVQFGLLSPEEIKAMAVVEILYPETYVDNKQKIGGLADPRLGTIERALKCPTCHCNNDQCTGHFGYLELHRPCYHIGYMARIKKLLECVCHSCFRVKCSPTDPKYMKILQIKDNERRAREIWELCKGKTTCEAGDPQKGGCGAKQPSLRKEGLHFTATYKTSSRAAKDDEEDTTTNVNDNDKKVYTAKRVYAILKNISDAECQKLGCNTRPEWMMITVIAVPPPQMRPSVYAQGVGRSEDDLTYKLGEIVKANIEVKKNTDDAAPEHTIAEAENLLQYHVATYMNNEVSSIPQATHKNGRPIKSIRARLKGKGGRLRSNLMGKRVDFSARTVITGDPNLSLDEVGVPMSIAMTLTFPEVVTKYNMEEMKTLVLNGPEKYPGANYLISGGTSGTKVIRKDLGYIQNRETIKLSLGDRVERHLKDGDIVLFNRQPSLHKMSMMAHRVRVMLGSTFRLNLSVTTPYNADFDGDEMNLHVPQSYEARAELSEICMVPKQIVSPQANKPVMGIVQDTLCGIRMMTKRDCFIDQSTIMNLLMWIGNWDGVVPEPAIIFPKKLWTGKQLISMIIPKGTNLTSFHSAHPDGESTDISPGDTKVIIQDGELVAGIMCKRTVGTSQNSLVHVIWKDHGPEKTRDFFDGCQRIVNNWLLTNGFSIGIGDTIADEKTTENILETISTSKNNVLETIHEYEAGTLKQNPGMTVDETFESRVNQDLNRARDVSGTSAQKSLSEMNNVKAMVVSGSKGSFINISQMSACVGQQNVEGKRIPFGFKDRTLPHFVKGDNGASSRGFVENSYLRGLTPEELFFHAMGGREGLIDTAVKTAETGYIQRRLVKAMEDVHVAYDGTVRNAQGQVIQFLYGEDGMDGVMMERQTFDIVKLKDDVFCRKYQITDAEFKKGSVTQETQKRLQQSELNTKAQDQFDAEFQKLQSDRKTLRETYFANGNAQMPMPVNVTRLISNIRQELSIDNRNPTNMTAEDIIAIPQKVAELSSRLRVLFSNDPIAQEAAHNATILFKMHLRATLATKRVVEEYRLDTTAFDSLLKKIEHKFHKSLASPSEMVGTIAAQSIGEPATQMTLNSVDWDTQIVIARDGQIMTPKIGEFIHEYERTADTWRITTHADDQIYIDMKDDGHDWMAISCDTKGKMMWTKLEAITHHPVINEDGTDTIIEVELASGRKVKATKGRSFLTRDKNNDEVVDITGADLKPGDVLPIAMDMALDCDGGIQTIDAIDNIRLDYNFGFLAGAYVSAGTVSDVYVDFHSVRHHDLATICRILKDWSVEFDMTSTGVIANSEVLALALRRYFGDNVFKKLPGWILQVDDDFVAGFVNAYANVQTSSCGMMVHAMSKSIISVFSTLLLRYGIIARVSDDKQSHTMNIPREYFDEGGRLNLFAHSNSRNNKYQTTQDVFWDTILEIRECQPMSGRVYDLTVEKTRNFMTADAIVMKDTFHYAGVSSKNVTLGVPRLKEIINVAKNIKTPSTTIYLNADSSHDVEKAKEVQVSLEYTTVRKVTKDVGVHYDPDIENTNIEADRDLVEAYTSLLVGEDFTRYSPWVLRIILDRRMLVDKNVSITTIVAKIKAELPNEMDICASDENAEEQVIRCRILRDRDEEQQSSPETEDIFLQRTAAFILDDITLSGVESISRVFMVEKKNTVLNKQGDYETKNEWVLETDGTNLLEIMKMDDIDFRRTHSNNIVEILETLGVEAAREALLKELRNVIEFDGSYVNYRHLALLCDVMTKHGKLMPITRHGINRGESGPFMRASFEETTEILLDAAANGAVDHCRGVTENVLLGQMAPVGTGQFSVITNNRITRKAGVDEVTGDDIIDITEFEPPGPQQQPRAGARQGVRETRDQDRDSIYGGAPINIQFTPTSAPTQPTDTSILLHQF